MLNGTCKVFVVAVSERPVGEGAVAAAVATRAFRGRRKIFSVAADWDIAAHVIFRIWGGWGIRGAKQAFVRIITRLIADPRCLASVVHSKQRRSKLRLIVVLHSSRTLIRCSSEDVT